MSTRDFAVVTRRFQQKRQMMSNLRTLITKKVGIMPCFFRVKSNKILREQIQHTYAGKTLLPYELIMIYSKNLQGEEGMAEATICDMKGNSISKGAYVKYSGTNTRGKVKEIRSDDNKKWVLLDSTELLYDSNYVEVIREEEKAADREAQSLEEFKKRLEEKRATLQREMANVDECGA